MKKRDREKERTTSLRYALIRKMLMVRCMADHKQKYIEYGEIILI